MIEQDVNNNFPTSAVPSSLPTTPEGAGSRVAVRGVCGRPGALAKRCYRNWICATDAQPTYQDKLDHIEQLQDVDKAGPQAGSTSSAEK